MKLSTKIFLAIFLITLVPSIYLGQFVFAGIKISDNGIAIAFDVWGYLGIAAIIINNVFGGILFFRFLRTLSLSKVLFFSTMPVSIAYGVLLFLLSDLARVQSPMASTVRKVLNISTTNTYNTVLWAVLISIIYIAVIFFLYLYICRPVNRIEKIVSRLSDGRVKEDSFNIGKSNQFKNVEHALNKINYNYKDKDNMLKQTDLETQKFIPKQFLKFLGKSSITELELGNQVKKNATTLFCNLASDKEISHSYSLEENFNYLNSYLNVVSPIIRRYDGFVDKYMGEGILAVFPRPESAVDCAHAIFKAVTIKNRSHKDFPPVLARIGIHTGEVIFGILGEQERKIPTIVSEIDLATKIEDINKFLHTNVIISKPVLNDMPTKYRFSYRYLGSLTLEEGSNLPLYESLEIYPRDRREKLIHLKNKFENAVRRYNQQEYEGAAIEFEEILRLVPEDKPSYIYYNKAKEKANKED